MKTWIRRIAIAAFVLSFAPLVPRIGKVFAQSLPPPDFNFTGNTKAHINYETANPLCTFMYGPGAPRVISCNSPFYDGDSYSINAGIDVINATELDTDLRNNGLLVFLTPGSDNCDPSVSLSYQIIPGNQIHKTKNKKWTIYSWEGNAPTWTGFREEPNLDHMEMNLKVNNNDPTTKSSLHIEANANLCNWSDAGRYGTPLSSGQPITLGFYIGEFNGNDGDYDCTTFTPSFSAENISPAACFPPPYDLGP